MARVHTATAAKDYPEHGIAKGDVYFHWSFFRGPKQMSKTPPRPSQTTGSAKLSNLYAVQEAYDDAVNGANNVDDLVSALDEAISGAESSIEEYEEAISNLAADYMDEEGRKEEIINNFKDTLNREPSDDELREAYAALKVEGYDDLDEHEREAMLSDAHDFAGNPSLDI